MASDDPRRDRAAVAMLALAVLTVASVLVFDQRIVRGELAILEAVNGWPRSIGAPLEVVMHLGTMAAGIVVIVLVAAALLPQQPRPVLAVALAAAGAFFLDDVLKEAIQRPRPGAVVPDVVVVRDTASGFGFPSGHTTMAFALAAALHPLLPARLRWIPWVLATAVGLARMYVGVHWPMDVVGGAALGIAIGTGTSALVTSRYGRRAA